MHTRPLTGEPLALDLLNTEWLEDGHPHDHLATDDGLTSWLRERRLVGSAAPAAVRAALVEARAAVRGVLERPGEPAAREALNVVLARGRGRRGLGEQGPRGWVEVEGVGWEIAWRAAADLLDLLERAPQRVRRCGNPECVLYFLDTSKNASRRWCSMAACGNRLKARRHAGRPPRPSAGT